MARPDGSRAHPPERRQRERIRRKLLVLRRQIEPTFGSPALGQDGASGVEDEADRAATAQERELIGHVSEVLSTTAAEVTLALARLDDGTYGICEECGAAIPRERLEALPTASLCVACKQQEEGAAHGDDDNTQRRWEAAGRHHCFAAADEADDLLGTSIE